MGYPKLLTSDRGSEFRNNLDKELMKLLGIRRHYTTAYHPQAKRIDLKVLTGRRRDKRQNHRYTERLTIKAAYHNSHHARRV